MYSCVPHVTLLTPAKMHATSGRGRSCSLLLLLAALTLLGTIAGEHQQETVKEKQQETDKEQQQETDKEKQEDKEESQGDNKEEEQKKEEEHTGPPPFEDLYCGHMNCYDLLGVTR